MLTKKETSVEKWIAGLLSLVIVLLIVQVLGPFFFEFLRLFALKFIGG